MDWSMKFSYERLEAIYDAFEKLQEILEKQSKEHPYGDCDFPDALKVASCEFDLDEEEVEAVKGLYDNM